MEVCQCGNPLEGDPDRHGSRCGACWWARIRELCHGQAPRYTFVSGDREAFERQQAHIIDMIEGKKPEPVIEQLTLF